ncbi:hypothetical protein CJO80_16730 [Ralstonia solanacearum]|nr:hypothetical protein CJO80_16730 [Ralstonia solanacearum]
MLLQVRIDDLKRLFQCGMAFQSRLIDGIQEEIAVFPRLSPLLERRSDRPERECPGVAVDQLT